MVSIKKSFCEVFSLKICENVNFVMVLPSPLVAFLYVWESFGGWVERICSVSTARQFYRMTLYPLLSTVSTHEDRKTGKCPHMTEKLLTGM